MNLYLCGVLGRPGSPLDPWSPARSNFPTSSGAWAPCSRRSAPSDGGQYFAPSESETALHAWLAGAAGGRKKPAEALVRPRLRSYQGQRGNSPQSETPVSDRAAAAAAAPWLGPRVARRAMAGARTARRAPLAAP